ncbi:MAG: hypothetical protein M1839_009216 [Geoglossum umbratile]|nr:MAG: hypothetical protein M1839_009216 [Geoglossum umbratile]
MPKAPSARKALGPRQPSAARKRSEPYAKAAATTPTDEHKDSKSATPEQSSTTTPTSHLEILLPSPLPIYETCTAIRHKLRQFLAAPPPIPGESKANGATKPYTQKKLCEQLGVTPRTLARFMACGEGPMQGAEQGVYESA